MDYSLENHKYFIGKPISDLPTPALVVNLPVLKKNIDTLHQDVERLGIGFRPHVKTLKTLELTRMMIAEGKYKGMIASTIPEIKGALPLVEEGLVEECLYGIPVYPGVLPRLIELRKSLRLQLMVDNEQQVSFLEESASSQEPWDIFIKLDVGSHRAGVEANSDALHRLVKRAEKSSAVNIYGFYCHAGHSYGGRSRKEAEETLNIEVSSVLAAAKLLPSDRRLIISVGSTPTAHVVESLKASMPENVILELHAGNFPCNDLQQVSTGLVTESQQAVSVAAEVCSVYPERNEALVNAGVIALSREASAFSGFGRVVGSPAWGLVRLSQEHGIMGTSEGRKVDDDFKVVSYADIAAKGPKQSPEDAAAPQPPQILTDESASTASLVDVDMPSVHTVPNDFLEQEIQTETQAARIEREEEAKQEKRKRDSAASKAKQTDNWLIQQFSKLSDGEATGLTVANLATVVSLGAFLGYKGWGLYEKGRLDWKAVSYGVGILASAAAAQGAVGRYLYKGKKGGS
ncbi:unnamed protein product [Fusarium graminearum]|uniref:D-serine dehydratase n=1 Tax=Gibberella zeae (strain ATCC MYA-4620 / CBS 123657 / FGSC 9075 / NRRL 31084 / PH-1) TaxID=229533 RepID=A0A1C3YJA1_GIBZE|nr:hypothetical protein FG05_12139 [Fusarium graminearum]SCB64426.1 unnamed protein product [Fusarium graminearum]